MKNVGIDTIDYYIPKLFVDMHDLSLARDIPFEKLSQGLGMKKMSIPDCNEDTASLAANALLKLIITNKIDPSEIGRIYLGTETGLDSSKPISSYVIEVVEDLLSDSFGNRCFKNCDIVDLTFACISGVDALENCIDWIKGGEQRKAIVIATDIAKYKLGSTGEYTQGAGALSLLITENPRIISISNIWGVASKGTSDFFKPRRFFDKKDVFKEAASLMGSNPSDEEVLEILANNASKFWNSSNKKIEIYKEEPVYQGQFSNESYQERIYEALEHFKNQKNINFLTDWRFLIFHLPYAYHGRKMILEKWVLWLQENGEIDNLYNEVGKGKAGNRKKWLKTVSKSNLFNEFVKEKIIPGELASAEIGNMYTGSIFMSLISLLSSALEKGQDINNAKIGFLSYGSGSKAKIFEGTLENQWEEIIKGLDLFKKLEDRIQIDIASYEKLHNNEMILPLDASSKSIKLDKIESEELTVGLRKYKKNII
ncbi:uncharacterized protein METZ01_LOCUS16257 [marine metagenome]|uniref:Hydroxymethylglutaryl-CoA synthase n=1 Tax=marine metagenome TaxID=408172 RepID=A0A381PD50_9ZZZZ